MQLSHHRRFLAALVPGLLAYAGATASGRPDSHALRIVIAGDVFFLLYLATTLAFVQRTTAAELRARAANHDEGLPLILCVTGATVAISLVSVLVLLERGGSAGLLAVALAAVPLGWLTMHAMVAFHYANLFYAPVGDGDAGGLDFPATPEPGLWDFLYHAYVIGMTAQVSDVAVTGAAQRRTALAHGVLSFFYNTVILALAVNAAVNLTG